MAEIYPFAALRYDPEKVRLADVVTQPYDKITPEMQERYYNASPVNLVRIILGKPDGQDTENNNRYTRAARYLSDWRRQGILVQDSSPSFYAYSQRFELPGKGGAVERRGFIAAGRLYDYQEEVVFRHEQTLAKPKSDRLNLLRATATHFGQIFMLYSDPAQTIDSLLFEGNHYVWQEVTDEYGVLHRLRRITDPAILNIVQTAMADKKLIIADGHHRYETALNFRNQLRAAGASGCLAERANAAMMTFVNMDSPGLVILPTHRVVFGLPSFNVGQFLSRAQKYYDVRPLANPDVQEVLSSLAASRKQAVSFVAGLKDGLFLLASRPATTNHLPAEFSPRQRKLDVVHLHSLLLEEVLRISREAVNHQQHIRYVRDAGEALDSARRDGDVNIAFLMNPVLIEQVQEIAFAREVLPQKSTDFYPKLLSGLTMYLLDDACGG